MEPEGGPEPDWELIADVLQGLWEHAQNYIKQGKNANATWKGLFAPKLRAGIIQLSIIFI